MVDPNWFPTVSGTVPVYPIHINNPIEFFSPLKHYPIGLYDLIGSLAVTYLSSCLLVDNLTEPRFALATPVALPNNLLFDQFKAQSHRKRGKTLHGGFSGKVAFCKKRQSKKRQLLVHSYEPIRGNDPINAFFEEDRMPPPHETDNPSKIELRALKLRVQRPMEYEVLKSMMADCLGVPINQWVTVKVKLGRGKKVLEVTGLKDPQNRVVLYKQVSNSIVRVLDPSIQLDPYGSTKNAKYVEQMKTVEYG